MKKKTAKEKKKARVDSRPRSSPNSAIHDDVLRFLFLVLPVLLGFIAGSIIWPSVQLPFNNSLEIVSPLAGLKFNPASNILRFIVFISLPALLFFLMLRIPFIKNLFSSPQGHNIDIPDQTIAESLAAPGIHRIIKTVSVSLLAAWIMVSSGKFFLQPFQAEVLDFWHEGEFLTPAFNFIKTGKLWTGSYFAHGVLFDPLITVSGWKFFGHETIGARRVVDSFLDHLLPVALLIFFLAIIKTATEQKDSFNRIVLLQLLLMAWLISFAGDFQKLMQRDLPVLAGLSIMLWGFSCNQLWLGFLSGIFSPVCFLYSIDRGAFYTAIGITALAYFLLAGKEKSKTLRLILSWAGGVLIGFAGIAIIFGWTEFKEFISSTIHLYRTKDLIDSYIYPTPTNPFEECTLPMVLIGIQMLGLMYFTLRNYMQRKDMGIGLVHVIMVSASIFYFRYALGRSDHQHIAFGSTFAFLGIGFLSWMVFRNIRKIQIKIFLLILIMVSNALLLLLDFYHLPPLKNMIGAHQRIEELVMRPDSDFLERHTPSLTSNRFKIEYTGGNAVMKRFEQIFKNENRFFCLTNEAAWSYLLKKPTGTKYFLSWMASPKPDRELLINDLRHFSPEYILVYSNTIENNMDHIPTIARLPEVQRFIQMNYQFYEDVNGWHIWRKK